MRLSGVGMIALAAWLLRYDIALMTIRRSGLPRFVAACLLSGYAWLGVGRCHRALQRADVRRLQL